MTKIAKKMKKLNYAIFSLFSLSMLVFDVCVEVLIMKNIALFKYLSSLRVRIKLSD